MSWFETKLGKGAGSGKSKLENLENYKATPFWLPYGGSTKISFLDPPDKPFPVRHFHKIPRPVHFTNEETGETKTIELPGFVLCGKTDPKKRKCCICDYAKTVPKSEQWKYLPKAAWCMSILWHSGEIDEATGEPIPPKRILRFTSGKDTEKLKELRDTVEQDLKHLYNSIQYVTVKVTRSNKADNDKAAVIGELGTVLGNLNVADYPDIDLSPLSEEEIDSYFVTDPEELETVLAPFQLQSEIKIN